MRRKLRHYCDEPLERIRSVTQVDTRDGFKPAGLWVSAVGRDDWAAWCKAERFRDIGRQMAFDLELAPEHRILVMPARMTLEAFTRRYGFRRTLGDHTMRDPNISWEAVARDWQGLVIAPYQWAYRTDLLWYYPWDCASGCIWDADAVKAIHPVAPARQPPAHAGGPAP
jgi:hypothetical protein